MMEWEPSLLINCKKLSKERVEYFNIKGSNFLGFTFKENCPDIRNTKVIDIIVELQEFGLQVNVNDPMAKSKNVEM